MSAVCARERSAWFARVAHAGLTEIAGGGRVMVGTPYDKPSNTERRDKILRRSTAGTEPGRYIWSRPRAAQ